MIPIQPSLTSLWALFMYYIIFYCFKYDPSSCNLLGEIEEMWFGGYGSIPFGLFVWAQHIRATKWVRDTGSTLGSWKRSCTQNFHPKTTFMLWVTVAQLFCYTIFCLKHITNPKWLAWSAATTKCNLQGPARSKKHQPINLGYFIS